jgi:hypothetical protein
MQDVITVVSGLPRSGTSMMMRMLNAGGMEVVVDNLRKADEDNPVGYFEFEKVKKMKEDASWMGSVIGKVVKIISELLFDLPSGYHYKVIFMRRDMQEMLNSQRKMLERKGVKDEIKDEEMARFFQKHIAAIEEWFRGKAHIDVLYVDYNDAVKDPLKIAKQVNAFLDNALNTDKMASAVDGLLYRNRRTA